MLDYAANARVSFSTERMAEWLDESARRHGSTGPETLIDRFGVDDIEGFWQTVDTNLKAERFQLVFVSDRIGDELRRIIEFLNRHHCPLAQGFHLGRPATVADTTTLLEQAAVAAALAAEKLAAETS